jgi:sulfide:quinone oxidoreductase
MPAHPLHVLIAGGGVAGLEALLALRALAGGRVRLSLLAPEPDFVYRPLQTAEPFSLGHPARRPWAAIAQECGAELTADALAEVLPAERVVRRASGATVPYDALLVAVGAVPEPVAHATTFTGDPGREAMGGVLADLEERYTGSVAFMAPSGGWTLPLYELALMTAREVWAQGVDDARLVLVTPEARPLELFGEEAGVAVGELLAAEGIEFVGSAAPTAVPGGVEVRPGGPVVGAERVISLPRLRGPAIPGLPADAEGFLPVDEHGRVRGADGVYAAGDATDFPVKQGGLATQQADAVAEAIAAAAGAPVRARPFRPVLRGLLLTGARDRYLVRGGVGGHADCGNAAERPLWWPPTKISGRHLSPYLFEGGEEALLDRARYAPHVAVETPVA